MTGSSVVGSGSKEAIRRIGVLGLQGGVEEHLAMLKCIPGVVASTFLRADDLNQFDGLIFPGGESTAIGKLLLAFGLIDSLAAKIAAGFPVWGTCAGAILLAKELAGEKTRHLALMDITIERNAYGSQLDSFVEHKHIRTLDGIEGGEGAFPMVFIRAPKISGMGAAVEVIATHEAAVVACRQGNMVATSFHPELSGDPRFHRWFVEKVVGGHERH